MINVITKLLYLLALTPTESQGDPKLKDRVRWRRSTEEKSLTSLLDSMDFIEPSSYLSSLISSIEDKYKNKTNAEDESIGRSQNQYFKLSYVDGFDVRDAVYRFDGWNWKWAPVLSSFTPWTPWWAQKLGKYASKTVSAFKKLDKMGVDISEPFSSFSSPQSKSATLARVKAKIHQNKIKAKSKSKVKSSSTTTTTTTEKPGDKTDDEKVAKIAKAKTLVKFHGKKTTTTTPKPTTTTPMSTTTPIPTTTTTTSTESPTTTPKPTTTTTMSTTTPIPTTTEPPPTAITTTTTKGIPLFSWLFGDKEKVKMEEKTEGGHEIREEAYNAVMDKDSYYNNFRFINLVASAVMSLLAYCFTKDVESLRERADAKSDEDDAGLIQNRLWYAKKVEYFHWASAWFYFTAFLFADRNDSDTREFATIWQALGLTSQFGGLLFIGAGIYDALQKLDVTSLKSWKNLFI